MPMTDYAMSPALIETGDIYIEVYPMKSDGKGGASLIERCDTPEFYDVWLRPDDWDQNNGDSYGEWDDLTHEQAVAKVAELEALNPGIAVSWVSP